jgi:hypothetical protein
MSQTEWMKEVREKRKAETKNVKAALIAAGYKDVRVGHDRGTAWNWLSITVTFYGDYWENSRNVEAIAVKASGRTGRSTEDISITLNRATDDVEGARKARLLSPITAITDSYKVFHYEQYPSILVKPDLLMMKSPSNYLN